MIKKINIPEFFENMRISFNETMQEIISSVSEEMEIHSILKKTTVQETYRIPGKTNPDKGLSKKTNEQFLSSEDLVNLIVEILLELKSPDIYLKSGGVYIIHCGVRTSFYKYENYVVLIKALDTNTYSIEAHLFEESNIYTKGKFIYLPPEKPTEQDRVVTLFECVFFIIIFIVILHTIGEIIFKSRP